MTQRRVLVIDDEPVLGELVAQVFALEGFQTRCELFGEDGLQAARTWHPHAIVLDLMLPDMTGLDVCRHLRADPATARIGVVMLTAMAGEERRLEGFSAGADRYLTKPFSAVDVIEQVDSVLAEYEQSPKQRGEARFAFADEQRHREEVQHFQQRLLWATPMPADDIDRAGRVLLWAGENILRFSRKIGGVCPVQASARMYRDRLEYKFRLESLPEGMHVEEAFRHLTGLDNFHADGPVMELGERIVCSPLAAEMLVTKVFA